MICETPRSERPRIAVLTHVSGEHEQLLSHVDGLGVSSWPPDLHVVTSVLDRAVTRGRLPIGSDRWATEVVVLPTRRRDPFLPALQLASQRALRSAPDVIAFVSVHCIPGRRLLEALAEECLAHDSSTPALWHASVKGLKLPGSHWYPVQGLEELVDDEPTEDAADGPPWADAFAMTAADWQAVWPTVWADCASRDATITVDEAMEALGVQVREVPGAVVYRQHPGLAAAG